MATQLFDKWGLNAREQRALSVFLMVLLAFVVIGIPLGLSTMAASRRSDNEELRHVIESIQSSRVQIREQKARRESIVQRYKNAVPGLAAFIDEVARREKVEVSDSQERPEVAIGKRYKEHTTAVHFKRAGMLKIAKFLEGIDGSGKPVSVSKLNIRKRTGEPDSYDVELWVSAYDRIETAPPPPPEGDKNDKEKK